MRTRLFLCWAAVAGLALAFVVATDPGVGGEKGKEKDKKKEEGRKGKTIGVLVAKDKNTIDVRGDGEEAARKFFPQWVGGAPADGGGFDKEIVKVFAGLKVGSRVEIEWVFEERLRALKVRVLEAAKEGGDKEKGVKERKEGGDREKGVKEKKEGGDKEKGAKEKKEGDKKDKEVRKGKVIGVVVAKDAKFIEVKGDGEEAARKYFPRYLASDGGLEKTMLKTFAEVKIGARVELEWVFDERLRAVSLKILDAPK